MEKPERPTGTSTGPRAMRLSPAPHISVVVISEDKRSLLDERLAALLGPSRPPPADVIVVRAGAPSAERRQLEKAYPAARFMFAPSGTPISRLKAQGMAAAEGDIVVFVDDRRPLPRDWIERLEAVESGRLQTAGAGQGRPEAAHLSRNADDSTARGTTLSKAALAAIGRPSAGPRGPEQQVDG